MNFSTRRQRAVTLGSVAMITAFALGGLQASAHDAADYPTSGIVNATDYFYPSGSTDHAYNGYKVYLSSPRHADSGSRGECRNPGAEENVNGRLFNVHAANGLYINATYSPSSTYRNLHSRGFYTVVSRNSRDNGWASNRTESQNWGANIHIVTHSNAISGGCGAGGDYMLVMHNSGTDQALSNSVRTQLDASVPGGSQQWSSSVGELLTNASHGDAYVELQFHTNQTRQSWMYSSSYQAAHRYGVAVDAYLGYP